MKKDDPCEMYKIPVVIEFNISNFGVESNMKLNM